MKLLIHDLNKDDFELIFTNQLENTTVISNDSKINKCIGCFGCWIKTPATCVIKDEYKNMGKLISQSEEVIIISKCTYGGYSTFIKNVLDRSISYMHPYFVMKNGEMHHKNRYKDQFKLKVIFYGEDILEEEKKVAEKLVTANGINLNAKDSRVSFYNKLEEIRGEFI
ncbi:flavodoxin family protein [Romboutsia sp.]|uniref:flavodoxin family protein n=1 Tax=Romboutsia sp. TaxID=1965302 RepID=UPI003F391B3E